MKLINETYEDVGTLIVSYNSFALLNENIQTKTVLIQSFTNKYTTTISVPYNVSLKQEPLYTTVTYNQL